MAGHRKAWRSYYRGLTCAACALVALIVSASVGGQIGVDGTLLDYLVEARALLFSSSDALSDSPVAVIALDARSLEEPELAPYPRTLLAPIWATILHGLIEAGAKAVGFDLLFAYSANRFSPDYDRPFLEALGRHRDRVVTARSATTLPAPPILAALRNDEEGLGLAELFPDGDGAYRRIRAGHRTEQGEVVSTLANSLLRRAGAPSMPAEVVLALRHHPERIPTYAVIDVLRCADQAPQALANVFKGKIVLIGGTLPEEDQKISTGRYLPPLRTDSPPVHPCGLRRLAASNPDSPSVPGVFIHAALVEAVVSGHVTKTAPPAVVSPLAALTTVIGAAIGLASSPWVAAAAVLGIAAFLLAAATWLLAGDVWLPMALPLLGLALSPALAYVVRYLVEERARRLVEQEFRSISGLPRWMVDRLAGGETALKLDGEVRTVTVMFADLSGFTRLSCELPPAVLVALEKRFLSMIVAAVEAEGGWVNQFIGDCVMAIWGAPVPNPAHAKDAVRAAMRAAAKSGDMIAEARSRGEVTFTAVKIGLNSGEAVVGKIGTDARASYTAVGETVNIAARLESVPTLYACNIVVGPNTAEFAGDEFLFRELDCIQVKGREMPLAVFEPVAAHAAPANALCNRVRRYAEALSHYRAKRFQEAAALWDELACEERHSVAADTDISRAENPCSKMAERARAMGEHPPLGSWDGVWILTSK